MNQLISHIEFLLHDHNCVIIPDFGGFVVNTIPPQRDGLASFDAPICELVFNRDLTHNDGLLAQSYMKTCGNVTFELAMQKIEQDIQELKRQLREERHLEMGKLGSFTMHDDKRFVYTPGTFIRPALFGLNKAVLKPLIQMQPVVPLPKRENAQRLGRNVAVAAVSVAAVALLMFILPVSDSTIVRQSARMFAETGLLRSDKSQLVNKSEMATDLVANKVGKEEYPISSNELETPVTNAPEQNISDDLPKYYIVMGVYKGIESARKTTELLLNEGFHQTGWLERPDRIDVYAASFTDESAARLYLKEVHKKFPRHNDAWILKK